MNYKQTQQTHAALRTVRTAHHLRLAGLQHHPTHFYARPVALLLLMLLLRQERLPEPPAATPASAAAAAAASGGDMQKHEIGKAMRAAAATPGIGMKSTGRPALPLKTCTHNPAAAAAAAAGTRPRINPQTATKYTRSSNTQQQEMQHQLQQQPQQQYFAENQDRGGTSSSSSNNSSSSNSISRGLLT